MATFEFKEQSQALLKRLGQKSGAPVNPALAQAAVEAALREAYACGLKDAKSGGTVPRAIKTPSTVTAATPPPPDCPHEWEEAFLDGRAMGFKCLDCGVLQRDVQDRCDHYFVKLGAEETCVACRKTRRLK